jgi:LacI family gluconate utilization system Gnt-I transcriptional repressor
VDALGLPPGRIVATGKPTVSMVQGAQALEAMLDNWPDIDAIVCVSDLSGFGVLAECQRRGVDVPGRIALAALDARNRNERRNPETTRIEYRVVARETA